MAQALLAVREIDEDLFEEAERWKYRFDNGFAQQFASQWKVELDHLLDLKFPTKYCSWGRSILFSDASIKVTRLCIAGDGCNLCDFIFRTVDTPSNSAGRDTQIDRVGSALVLKHDGKRVLRLCSDLESAAPLNNQIQIGFPVLAPVKSHLRFALLRAWLQRCDDDHECKNSNPSGVLPTTLLDVGDPSVSDYSPGFLRLVPGSLATGKYIALSHCWGEPVHDQLLPDGKTPRYCTTRSNFENRQAGFSANDLPLTFRDAIEVARGLEVQYLWIDSLCILQGVDGNWMQESERMQEIYTSAYCTVAATSAEDSYSGFLNLKRNPKEEYLHVQDDQGQTVFVCTSVADFDVEVDHALLNTRAWVMQERFLSCRTIHFGTNQIYWECGKGVFCEDLTELISSSGSTKHFKLDPKFPNSLLQSGHHGTIQFLQSLLVDYSSRKLSKDTDKDVALAGLAVRIAAALDCQARYGIFNLYLRRNLLWQRSDMPMTRIPYESGKVPSWSWMAYTGRIKFVVEDRFGDFDGYRELKFAAEDKEALITDLWEFVECSLKEEVGGSGATLREIVTPSGERIGTMSYDVENGQDIPLIGSAVVGWSNSKESGQRDCYILVLRHRSGNEYERVGVGMIQQNYLSRQKLDVRIV